MKSLKVRIDFCEFFFCIYSTWYFLPIFKGLFFGGTWNLVFFSFYMVSVFLMGLKCVAKKFNRQELLIILPILCYMLVFSSFCLLNWQDANSHIRVSYTYWGTFIFYFLTSNNMGTRIGTGKYLIFLYAITYITTFIGVSTDITVVRALSYAATEETISKTYLLKNIANLYFIQTTVLLVPFIIYGIYNSSKKKIKIILIIFLLIELYFVFSASLTISIILYFIALVISIISLNKKIEKKYKIVAFIILLLIIVIGVESINWQDVFKWLGTNIDNKYISDRMLSLEAMFSGVGNTGDAGLRMDLYNSSVRTFLENPIGVGPNYSYIKFDSGIGHHSQMLDDFARYGIFAIVFYIMFITSYKNMLQKKYREIGMESIVMPLILIYILMIILNLSFRSSYESIFMLFIIPVIPDTVTKYRKLNLN